MSNSQEIKVWDLLVRIFHWSLLVSVLVAFITEDDLLTLHTWAGYSVAALIAVRLIWGLIGSHYARFSEFVRPPSVIHRYIKDVIAFRAERHIGHNPAGGAMVMALIVMLVLVSLSGMSTYGILEYSGPLASVLSGAPESWGSLIKEMHEFLADGLLVLVGLHLGGIAIASLQHRENLVRAMWTGKKRIDE